MGISRGVLLLERVGGTQVAYAEGVLLLERVGGTQVGEIPGTGGGRAYAESIRIWLGGWVVGCVVAIKAP